MIHNDLVATFVRIRLTFPNIAFLLDISFTLPVPIPDKEKKSIYKTF